MPLSKTQRNVLRALKYTLVKCWCGCGEKEPSGTAGMNANWCSQRENNMEFPQKVKNRTIM